MGYFEYAQSVGVREDLPDAYRKVWEIIAAPGNWWTAQQRIAIAEEFRNARTCGFCAARKRALSPYAVEGEHDSTTELPSAAVDAIHRITTDANRLTASYLAELDAQGVSDGHYVELLGIVVALISIDDFHRALGLDQESLPPPGANEAPSQYRPAGAAEHGAWVPMVKPEDVTEAEADLYDGAPQTGNVIAAMSLVPDSVRLLKTISNVQYLPAVDVANPHANGGRAITRMQMELLAGRVSAINECFY
jgi:hypothetical protein